MAKKKTTDATSSELSFEASLQNLQEIVNQLEAGQLGLEDSLKQYEQGMALMRHCWGVLQKTEQKIEQLTGFNADGEPVCEPFDASATLQQREQTAGRRKQSAEKATAEKITAEKPAAEKSTTEDSTTETESQTESKSDPSEKKSRTNLF